MPGVRAVVVIDPAKSRNSPVKEKTTFGLKGTTESAARRGGDRRSLLAGKDGARSPAGRMGSGRRRTSGRRRRNVRQELAAKRDRAASGKSRAQGKGDARQRHGQRGWSRREYLTPYGENAVMEPLNATALVTAGQRRSLGCNAGHRQAFWVAVDETGLDPAKVKLHATYVGGNFGRRTQAEDIRMAVAVARALPRGSGQDDLEPRGMLPSRPLSHADDIPVQGRA